MISIDAPSTSLSTEPLSKRAKLRMANRPERKPVLDDQFRLHIDIEKLKAERPQFHLDNVVAPLDSHKKVLNPKKKLFPIIPPPPIKQPFVKKPRDPNYPFRTRKLPKKLPIIFDYNSDDDEPLYREKLPRFVRKKWLEELDNLDAEEKSILDGTHPEIVALKDANKEEMANELAKLDKIINAEKDKFLTAQRADRSVHQAEQDRRSAAILERVTEDVEYKFDNIEAEVAAMDLNAAPGPPPPVSKKSLRKRPFGSRSRGGIETPEGEFIPRVVGKKGKKSLLQAPQISHLLSEAQINDDLRKLGKYDPASKNCHLYKVSLDNQKMVYEGKSFPRGVALFVQTNNYKMFPALIQQVTENWITFRSTMPGDTRSVAATVEDLESGRVLVSKKGNL